MAWYTDVDWCKRFETSLELNPFPWHGFLGVILKKKECIILDVIYFFRDLTCVGPDVQICCYSFIFLCKVSNTVGQVSLSLCKYEKSLHAENIEDGFKILEWHEKHVKTDRVCAIISFFQGQLESIKKIIGQCNSRENWKSNQSQEQKFHKIEGLQYVRVDSSWALPL